MCALATAQARALGCLPELRRSLRGIESLTFGGRLEDSLPRAQCFHLHLPAARGLRQVSLWPMRFARPPASRRELATVQTGRTDDETPTGGSARSRRYQEARETAEV